ncbi:MAG: bifunctional YncE family protein/alkaline phosphatase family protein [Paludibacteraceae bacterium]
MKKSVLSFTIFVLSIIILNGQTLEDIERTRVILPNGWSLTSVGKQMQLGDLPLNMAVSHNKKLLAVTNNGQSEQSIEIFDTKNETRTDSVKIPKSWYGLAFSNNDKYLYVSGGNDNWILRYRVSNGKLTEDSKYILGKPWPNLISPTGIALDENSDKMYVVTKEDKSLYIFSIRDHKPVEKISLGEPAYMCVLSQNKNTLYISSWGGKKVQLFDTKNAHLSGEIPVGSHPNEMCISNDGKHLFVANSDDNSVSVISTNDNKVIEVLNAALYPDAPPGSTTNGLALSDDDKTLYVANADNNCLAVFNVSEPKRSYSLGFIPVGWYPTNVKWINRKIYVTNGKGLTSLPNPLGPNPTDSKETVSHHEGDKVTEIPVQYIGGLFKGSLSIIPEPYGAQLEIYSRAVYNNIPYSKEKELYTEGGQYNPIPFRVGDTSPIKYVFYVIKENRTYDQILGDIPEGNGDKNLLLFGEKITPNLHKLAREYVLFDNFYVNAEVSMDGHNWSMGAYANDYLEKTWPTSYGGRGGSYSGEGQYYMGNNRDGFIWNNCNRNGVTYRSYGEFGDRGKANLPVLQGHMATGFKGWDLNFKDIHRVEQWKKDFDSLLVINSVPQFSTIRLGNDHTQGLAKGRPTPYAQVADNDMAVGLLVDYLSHSKIWNESVVFIVEDDAQNGSDHVDAHRSPLFVIGPYVKRNFADHTMYSTTSVLRTIELILGMPPMTQYDAAATPLWRSFNDRPDYTAYKHIPAQIDLDALNGDNKLSDISKSMDFSHEDRVPDLSFNQVLWQGLKGENPPAPRRAAFLKISQTNENEDN